jgi:hypothetical protein
MREHFIVVIEPSYIDDEYDKISVTLYVDDFKFGYSQVLHVDETERELLTLIDRMKQKIRERVNGNTQQT